MSAGPAEEGGGLAPAWSGGPAAGRSQPAAVVLSALGVLVLPRVGRPRGAGDPRGPTWQCAAKRPQGCPRIKCLRRSGGRPTFPHLTPETLLRWLLVVSGGRSSETTRGEKHTDGRNPLVRWW